ncbi:MAG TPA: amino acid racemase [Candidatus Blautia intestinigallinarum]|nr:amino acid racemase [Candidatus Cottocaccamicrobium excrementipullorum]HIV35146.1 amino acid racemase [Candidatus Blautia intestinigallinarum]
MRKTIGILGGMGPLATCDLFSKITQITDASCDQEHVRICIDSNTEISDRTNAIIHHGKDPVPEMVKSAVRLQGLGADVLIMPCNTAHYFYDRILPFVDIPFLSMIDETAKVISDRGLRKIGLLATDGTLQTAVYEKAFKKRGISIVVPPPENQVHIMDLIYNGVKAGNKEIDTKPTKKTIEDLFRKGAQTLVLGCTELPVAFDLYGFDYPKTDPTLILASRAVQFVGAKVKKEYL